MFSLKLDKINLDLDLDIHNPSFNPLVSYIVSYTSHSVPSIRTLLNAGKYSQVVEPGLSNDLTGETLVKKVL